jgi:8-oxo-dGTP pyrophosphatase MutT (NUDIX family)
MTEIREAATVVLLRDAEPGLQTWLLRRVPKMAFAPGMSVFPGGGVDPVDRQLDDVAAPERIARQLGTDVEHAAVLIRTAVREVAEEADVTLIPGALWPWARWITPEAEPRRYDTFFFVAALPPGAAAASVTSEASHADWISVLGALDEYHRGERPMLPPTFATLTELSRYPTTADVVRAAAERSMAPIQPKLRQEPDGAWVADLGNGTVFALPPGFHTASGRPL